MRFHTNTLTAGKVAKIVNEQVNCGAYIRTATDHGSQQRKQAVELKLYGSSNRYPNFGRNDNGDMAATWDEWGMVIAAMFEADPEMTCRAYESEADFHYKTGTRFADGGPDERHGTHKWEFAAPRVHECACGAARRF